MKWFLLMLALLTSACGDAVLGPSGTDRPKVDPVPVVRGF